jgi:hypothetical protein
METEQSNMSTRKTVENIIILFILTSGLFVALAIVYCVLKLFNVR